MTGWRDRGARDFGAAPTPVPAKSGALRAWHLVAAGLVIAAAVAHFSGRKSSPVEAILADLRKLEISKLDDRALQAARQMVKKARRALGGPKIGFSKDKARKSKYETSIRDLERRLAERAKALARKQKLR